jgi:hypothetical protein
VTKLIWDIDSSTYVYAKENYYENQSSRVKKFRNYAKKCNDIKSKIEDKTAIKTEDKTDSESDDKNEEDTIPCSSQ